MRVMISAQQEPERLVQNVSDLDIVTESSGTMLEQWKVIHCFPQNSLEKQLAKRWPPPKDASWLPYWFGDCVKGLTKERLALFQWLRKRAPEPVSDTEGLLESLEAYDILSADEPLPAQSVVVDELKVSGKPFVVIAYRQNAGGPTSSMAFWAIGGLAAGALLLDLYTKRNGPSRT